MRDYISIYFSGSICLEQWIIKINMTRVWNDENRRLNQSINIEILRN